MEALHNRVAVGSYEGRTRPVTCTAACGGQVSSLRQPGVPPLSRLYTTNDAKQRAVTVTGSFECGCQPYIGGLVAQTASQTFSVSGSCAEYVQWKRSPYGYCSKEDTVVAVHATKGIQLKQWESMWSLCTICVQSPLYYNSIIYALCVTILFRSKCCVHSM